MLANEFRPRRFKDMVGQKMVPTIKNRANKGISHGWLLTGNKGSGKTTAANIIAMLYNCTNKTEDGEPCLECESCKSALNKTNINIMEINAASKNGINDIRDIIEKTKYSTDGVRVIKLDEAHMLTEQAQNGILAILEEPPKNCSFIFTTTDPLSLIAPLRSRCMRFDFYKLSNKTIYEYIRNICEKTNIKYEENALKIIAELADGAMRDALTILDQVSSNEKVTEEEVRNCLGLDTDERLLLITEAIMNKDKSAAIIEAANVFEEGLNPSIFVNKLIKFLRQIRMYKIFNKISPVFSENERNFITKNSDNFLATELERYLSDLTDIEKEMRYNSSNAQTIFEMFLLKSIDLISLSLQELLDAKENIIKVLSTRYKEASDELNNSSIVAKDNIIIINGVSQKYKKIITEGFIKSLNKKVEVLYL